MCQTKLKLLTKRNRGRNVRGVMGEVKVFIRGWIGYFRSADMKRTIMYLTVIIDWFSRKIMGWTLSDTLDTAPVLETVKEAVGRYGVPAIVNSDQGCQFTSGEYKNLLRQYGIRQSMDGKSRWTDNVMIERWFRGYVQNFL